MHHTHRSRLSIAAVSLAGLLGGLQGCSSGSLGSDVGEAGNGLPEARAQVLTAGDNMKYREGTEILLSAAASEDRDGPILRYAWSQTAGPAVTLVERSTAVVSFTAPDVSAETTMSFQLSVFDSDDASASAPISVTVVPAQDADEFLSLDVRSGAATTGTFDGFKAILALADGGAPLDAQPFTFSAQAYVAYPPRANPSADCTLDPSEFASGVPAQTSSGCLIGQFEDLTALLLAGGGSGVTGEWPAGAPVPAAGQTVDTLINDAWWNPRVSLPLPRLDVADFNQSLLDSGRRDQIIDPFSVHRAQTFIALELNAPQNQGFANLVLTTADDQPIALPASGSAIVPNDGTGLPTTAIVLLENLYAGITGKESALTAEVYYRTVDPDNSRVTYNQWLQQAGLSSDDQGTFRAEAVAGTGPYAHAVYLNNFDLGFGRDMYTHTDEFGNLYSVVENYATLEGAIRRTDMIVAVAMELSPLGDPSDTSAEKFVKFFSYIDDGTGDAVRATSMNFDGRGERYTPGNCIACHGGSKPPGFSELVPVAGCADMTDPACFTWPAANRDGDNIADGNLNATFLPWDLESFLYADTDPALVGAPARFDGTTVADDLARDFGDFSRASQEAQLKKLNQAIYDTYCDAAVTPDCQTDAARRLVAHWYGGVDMDGQLIGNFDDSSAPAGWQNAEVVPAPTVADPNAMGVNPDAAEQIYQDVYAQNCRMCHTNIMDESLRFDTYQAFLAQQDAIVASTFETGIMPAARLTADRFWTEGDALAATTLAEHFGVMAVDGQLGPQPAAVVGGTTLMIERADPVLLSGKDSTFASSYAWDVTYTPPAELAGNPKFSSFVPMVVGSTLEDASFEARLPGRYAVALTINNAVTSDPTVIDVPNFSPVTSDLMLTVDEGQSRSISVRDALNQQCAAGDADCAEVFGDGPSDIVVDLSVWDQTAFGSATLTDAQAGTVAIDATQPGPIDVALPYTVTDIDGEVATGSVNVSIVALQAPVLMDDARTMDAQTTLPDGNLNRRLTIDVLADDSVAAGAGPLSLTSFTQPAAGVVTQDGDNVVYEPNLGFLGTDTFTYLAQDNNPTGARVSETVATVSVTVEPTVTFAGDVQMAFDDAGCDACHTSAANGDFTDCDRLRMEVEAPANARASSILNRPNISSHNTTSWNSGMPEYQVVLRWIEEGATGPSCSP